MEDSSDFYSPILNPTSRIVICKNYRSILVSAKLALIFALLHVNPSAGADGLFDIISFSGAGAGQTATGTSNGINWTLSHTFISDTNPTVLDGSYTRFTDPAFYSPGLSDADAIHITGTDFTITFDTPISSILFYLSDDAGTANLDLGIVPNLISGNVGISGTQASPSLSGGIIRYDNLMTLSLTHSANVFDGMDLAWVATPVPLPPALYLFAAAYFFISSKRRSTS